MGLSASPLGFAFSSSTATIGGGLVRPVITAKLTEICPREISGRALGYQECFSALIRTFAPAVFGVVYDHVSRTGPYYMCAIASFLAGVLILLVPKPVQYRVPTNDAAQVEGPRPKPIQGGAPPAEVLGGSMPRLLPLASEDVALSIHEP